MSDLSRKYGISETTYYNWKAKYGGMEISDVKRRHDLEEENRQLKQLYAQISLDHTGSHSSGTATVVLSSRYTPLNY